jgi:hypothetical protein
MDNIIPLIVICAAMSAQKDRTNQAAVGVFGYFYCASLVISYLFNGEPEYFYWSIASSPLFIIALSILRKTTLMILLLSLTEFALLLVDVISVLAYNLRLEWLYQLRWVPETAFIVLQLAALMVRNGTPTRLPLFRVNMAEYTGRLVRALLYR